MNPIIATNLEAIRRLCEAYGVARRDVFGSVTTPRFDQAGSDIDLLAHNAPETDHGPWMKRHFALRDELTELLGRTVDLVMSGGLRNPYFIRAVNQSRQLLYAG